MIKKNLSPYGLKSTLAIMCLLFFAHIQTGFAQEKTVNGTIIDLATRETIPGVNIFIKGSSTGTTSDVDGRFSLTVPNAATDILVVSFIGYNQTEHPVDNKSEVKINMQASMESLKEVVVTGYGSQSKKEISGSVSNVTAKEFNKGVARDASDLLVGKVAGLVITQAGGDVTGASTLRLRGTASLKGNSAPLIVIDGVPDQELSSVAPQDIESISVLKDAASAAIYGSRSAGGVILITTKQGRESKTNLVYDGFVSLDFVANKPQMLNAEEWRIASKEVAPDTDLKPFDKGADTDWFGELMRMGVSQNHALSMSGGTKTSNYRATVAYLNREGVVTGNKSERLNTRFSFTQKAINNRLKLTFVGTSTQVNYYPTNRRNFLLAYNMLPVYPVYNPDGSWFETLQYDQGNPVRNLTYNYNQNKVNLFAGNANANFMVANNFFANLSLHSSRRNRDENQYNNSQTEAGRADNGYGRREASTYDKRLLEFTLNYNHTLGKNKFDYLAGYSWQENENQGVKAENRNFITDYLQANNLQAGEGLRPTNTSSYKNSSRLISFFGRANYNYAEKYLVSLIVRRDGSSKFGANHKWGVFPSASAAWRITSEQFMQNSTTITELKLRAGYGITGNQDGLDPYKSMAIYKADGTYLYNGDWRTVYKLSQNPNPDLKWEQTAMLNIGVDFELWKGRLSGTIEWYDKRTTDMLYEYKVPTPPYQYDILMANAGAMSNKGIEFYLTAYAIQRKDFSWNTTVNFARNKNLVTRLSDDKVQTERVFIGNPGIRGGSDTQTHIIEEGRPLGTFYGWKALGIRDGKYVFQNAQGKEVGSGDVTNEDRTYIGCAQPDFTFGWNNTFSYKNLDMSFFFRGVVGNDVLNSSRMQYATTQWLPGSNVMKEALTLGLKETPKYSSFYIENGSFVRLDNLNLGYTINTDNVNWINKLRVYFTAQNLFVITGYKGLDPEATMERIDEMGVESKEFYPRARTYTFGVNITL